MKTYLIAANWKQNGTKKSLRRLTKGIIKNAKNKKKAVDRPASHQRLFGGSIAGTPVLSHISWSASLHSDGQA